MYSLLFNAAAEMLRSTLVTHVKELMKTSV
jgi:hypothetical protein